jgi:diaminohydroxyphosphoribosylaminopyrimidine deaminase / 5-amino-6-(5-phosphoribosylamino)uracil reductase
MNAPAHDHAADQTTDQHYMHRCLDLAKQAIGRTAPNPMVGCIIVKNGEIIGEGFHPKAGEPHAEIFALRAAGDQATGATLYVNLEPCNHHGRTPPCSAAVIAAGIDRVVIGMVDPNPQVAGSGIATLRAHGISVTVGIAEDACQTLNEAFVHRIQTKRPFGLLKYAMTLDGKIATTTGHSAWITRPDSRHWVHTLRSHCDAILIGGNTVRQDNPHLTTHQVSDHNPLRVILSRSFDLPTTANLWDTTSVPTRIYTEGQPNPVMRQAIEAQGVEILSLETLTPDAVMADLYDRGLSQVLWECGGTLAAAAIQDQAVQKIYAFIAPKIIGGTDAPSPIGDLGLLKMTKAIELEKVRLQSMAADFLIEGYLRRSSRSVPKTHHP